MNDRFPKCYFYITEKKLPRNCILAPIVNHWDSIIDLCCVYNIHPTSVFEDNEIAAISSNVSDLLFQKWEEERVFSPLPSCCCRSTEVVNWCAVRLPSPYPHVSVTLWLPVLGTNLIIIFIVINLIVIIMLPYMRATRILIVRDAYRSLTMASNHQRDYGYSLLLLLVGLGESLETVACLGRSPTVWTEVLTPMSTRKDDQRCRK